MSSDATRHKLDLAAYLRRWGTDGEVSTPAKDAERGQRGDESKGNKRRQGGK